MSNLLKNNGVIGVLMGGMSSEREISFKSGHAIVNALTQGGYSVKPIEINFSDEERNLDSLKQSQIDFAFIALHGRFGEDGGIQTILDRAGIPYTGSGVKASALAFNKAECQRLLKSKGIPVARHLIIKFSEAFDLEEIVSTLGLPIVVKPCCEGSSIGVHRVDRRDQLQLALDQAFEYGPEIIIEQFISGREFTVGVLDKEALPVVEVIPKNDFFDFQSKYQKGLTAYMVPAQISTELAGRMQGLACLTHQAVGCEVFSRVDFRVDEKQNPFILEINTIPGFTDTSLFPKAAQHAGIGFKEVCSRLIELSYVKK